MWLTTKFIIGYVFRSICNNLLRSFTAIFSILLIVSSTVALLVWLEESPTIAIESAFEDRGYEIKVREVYYGKRKLESLQSFIESDPIVESSAIIHRSKFLYNLNERNASTFNIVDPIETDYYISEDNLENGAYFIPEEFIHNIKSMLEFEDNSKATFNVGTTNDSTGVIISRRFLNLINERTNHTYNIGDTLDFSFATSYLPDFYPFLDGLNPFELNDMTINGIYSRKTFQSGYQLKFYPETLGDGIYISNKVLETPADLISIMESNGFFPQLYIRADRQKLLKLGFTNSVTEIENIAERIYREGQYRITIDLEEVRSILNSLERSRTALILTLLPLIIITEIFFIILIPHILKNRKEELFYFRLKGSTNNKIFIVELIEFSFLVIVGTILGILTGGLFIDILLNSDSFLDLSNVDFSLGWTLLQTSESTLWIQGIILVLMLNLFYVFTQLFVVTRTLQQVETESGIEQNNGNLNLSNNTVFVLISISTLFLVYTTVAPSTGVSALPIDLIPLISVMLLFVWIFFSIFSPQILLQFIQKIFESIKIFKNPKRKLTWLNIVRRKKQYQSFLGLLILTVSLLSFTLVYYTTLAENNQKNAFYEVGGNYKLFTDDVDYRNFTSKVTNIEGIESCVGLPTATVRMDRHKFVLIGIDPEEYTHTTQSYEPVVVDGPPAERLIYKLDENPTKTIIMNDHLARMYKWSVGQEIGVQDLQEGWGSEYNLKIEGIIKSAPGIGLMYESGHELGFYDYAGFALVNIQLLEIFEYYLTNTFVVTVVPTESSDLVMRELNQIPEVQKLYKLENALDYREVFLRKTGIQGILTINFFGAICMSLIGVAVFYQYLLDRRLTEFAIFQAFGSTKEKILRIAFTESIFLILFGLSLGVITGFLFGGSFLFITRTLTVSPHNVFLLELAFSPMSLIFGLGIITFGLLVAASLPLKKIYSLEIASLLRNL